MNTEIFELSEEEILAIAGGSQIDPPSPSQATSTVGIEIPEVNNNPPG